MALADSEGIAGLTMRGLASHLDVRPMSIYHYVASKDELLDALIEQVYAEMSRPDPAAADWRGELTRRTETVRSVLLRHPWAISLLETRTTPSRPSTLGHHESVLATLLAGGCTPGVAARAYVLLDSYVYGFVLQELTIPAADPHPGAAGGLDASLEAGRYPNLRSARLAMVSDPEYDMGKAFSPGLEVVFDGIERWRSAC